MALDVWLDLPATAREEAQSRRVVAIEYFLAGEYWYLRDYWPASSSTGKVIDTFDSTHFEGPNLDQLRGRLRAARESLEGRPKQWKQLIGTDRAGKAMFRLVDRDALEAMIARLVDAIRQAESGGGRIRFVGD